MRNWLDDSSTKKGGCVQYLGQRPPLKDSKTYATRFLRPSLLHRSCSGTHVCGSHGTSACDGRRNFRSASLSSSFRLADVLFFLSTKMLSLSSCPSSSEVPAQNAHTFFLFPSGMTIAETSTWKKTTAKQCGLGVTLVPFLLLLSRNVSRWSTQKNSLSRFGHPGPALLTVPVSTGSPRRKVAELFEV